MRPNRHHLTGALAALLVVGALLVAAFASHNLHLSGAAVKTAINSTFGAQQAKTHAQFLGNPKAPFLGPYKQGQCGPGIRLMEGALHHLAHPVRPTAGAKCFGSATRKQVIVFQKRLHYKPTGVYNYATHRQLVLRGGYSKAALGDLRYLLSQRLAAEHAQLVVQEHKTIQIIAAHAAAVGGSSLPYTQGPERSNFPPWPQIPPNTDCSGFATWMLYQDGVGYTVGYFGRGSSVGWTGTLTTQGKLVSYGSTSTKNLKPGDLIFYGSPPSWGHVTVYIGSGLVISHGGRGVNILRYDYTAPGEIRRYIF